MSHLMFWCNFSSACYFLTANQPNQPTLPVWLIGDFCTSALPHFFCRHFSNHKHTQIYTYIRINTYTVDVNIKKMLCMRRRISYLRQNTQRTMPSNGFTMSLAVCKKAQNQNDTLNVLKVTLNTFFHYFLKLHRVFFCYSMERTFLVSRRGTKQAQLECWRLLMPKITRSISAQHGTTRVQRLRRLFV